MYRILIVGCGHMGSSHALAYHGLENCKIVGLVSRGYASRAALNEKLGGNYDLYSSFEDALENTEPDIVVISSYTESHAPYAIKSMEAGAHVFLEKPVSANVEDAIKVIETAKTYRRKLVVGYILRVHPSWIKFIEIAGQLGSPKVMRLNLNQQSSGEEWRIHKNLMTSTSPIVDCGVHYVDVMCQVTKSRPVKVFAVGARLTEEIPDSMYNYGQLQVIFEDGSVGWYEAGWGPMMSNTAYFVKDIIGPDGSISMVEKQGGSSDDIDSHTKTDRLLRHSWKAVDGGEELSDEWIDTSDEPGHDELCLREQQTLIRAIETDEDLSDHWNAAIDSLKVVLAADRSVETGQPVDL